MTPIAVAPIDLTSLYDAVVADMQAAGWTCAFAFGQREPQKHINATSGMYRRVVFSPGDDSGRVGNEAPARFVGSNPKPLYALDEYAQVYCWAKDASVGAGDREDYVAARALYSAVRAAIARAARSNANCESPRWVIDTRERRFGYEISFAVRFGTTVHDLASPTTSCAPDLSLAIGSDEL